MIYCAVCREWLDPIARPCRSDSSIFENILPQGHDGALIWTSDIVAPPQARLSGLAALAGGDAQPADRLLDGASPLHLHIVGPDYFERGSKAYLNYAKLRELWKACLRADYDPQVNIQSLKGNFAPLDAKGRKSLQEVLK